MNHKIILVVDDDHDVLSALKDACVTQSDQQILGAPDFAEALAILSTTKVDVLVADVLLSGNEDKSGVALSFEALEAWPNIALVLISADPPATFGEHSKRAVCLQKPFGRDVLFDAIEQASSKAGYGIQR